MKKRFQLLALSVLCAVFAHAQYVAPSEGVFRIVNVAYNAALMEDFLNHTLHCTATIGDNDDYEQLWILKASENGYSLQNVFTGAYVQTGNSKNEVNYWTGAEPKTFTFEAAEKANAYSIWDTGLSGKNGLHSKGANGNVVKWVACDASSWYLIRVDLSDEDVAAARDEYARLTGGDKLPGYQTVLNEVFTDKACTILSEAYAAKSAEEIEAALADKLPAELVAMAVKVKNNVWDEPNEKEDKLGWDDAYAKKFRVQMIEPYSIAGEITEWIGHQGHTNMDNPTGLYANKREVLYVMVEGEVKEGAELWANWIVGHSKMPNYNNGYGNGIRLKEGLNVVPMASDGSALYINYLVHTFDKTTWTFAHKLSEFDDLKVHIEGGYINGYYNVVGDALYTPDNDDDWVYYEERANLENITILGRYEVLQFELNDVIDYWDEKEQAYWSHRGLAKLFPEELPTEMPNSPAFTAPNQRINGIVEAWDRIFLAEKMTLGVASRAEVDSMNKLFPRWDGDWKNTAEIYNYDETLYAFCDSIKDRDGDYGEYYNHHGLAYGTRSGYMYGSYDHSGYHINTTPSILTAIATEAGPTWGPAHEIGHQHQALYTLNGEMEVTNNTFANVAAWYMGMGTSRVNGTEGNLAHVYDNFKNGGYLLSNNIWVLTQRYYRLWLYYHRAGNNTQFFPRLFELIRLHPMERSYGSDSEMQRNEKTGEMESVSFQLTNGYRSYLHFYKLCCEAAQEDLTEFFRAYGCFTPVDGVFQGDYTNSKYYTTQKEIDKAIAEVKAKGYPVNNKVLFINDCTDVVTYGHDGKTRRSFWDGETGGGANGKVGLYVDYLKGTPITGEYVYTLEDLKLTIKGKGSGAVGFAIYNQKGEIQAFSNNYSFYLNKETKNKLRTGEAVLYAVSATGEDVVVNRELGEVSDQKYLLETALEVAKNYLLKVDDTGAKVGYLLSESIVDYVALVAEIENVINSEDTSVKSYGEWYLALDAENARIETNTALRVLFTPDCFYSVTLSSNESRYMVSADAGLNAPILDAPAYSAQWRFVPAEAEGTYYLQNRETGSYISTANSGSRVKADSLSVSGAVAFRLVADAPGEFYIQRADNSNINLYNATLNRVFAGSDASGKAKWTLSLKDNMLGLPEKSSTDEVIAYQLQRTDYGSYAKYSTLKGKAKGRIISSEDNGVSDVNYWFYFKEGNVEGKYAIYSYATGLSVTSSSNSLYADKASNTTVDYAINLNESANGLVISAEAGDWYMNASNYAVLKSGENTSWKLIKMNAISITMNQKEVALNKGETAELSAETNDGMAISWSSSDNSVATVDKAGKVTAVAAGSATITAATSNGVLKATCAVTVTDDGSGIATATSGLNVQVQGGLILVEGLSNGTDVCVYDAAGSLIGTVVATNGAATFNTGLAEGATVIVKVGDHSMKVSIR